MISEAETEGTANSSNTDEVGEVEKDDAWDISAGGLEEEDLVGIGFESDREYSREDSEDENEEPEGDFSDVEL